MAKRISRVAASWPGPIGALAVVWAVVLLRMKRAWRSGPVRQAYRLGRMLGPVPGRMEGPRASWAASRSPRWRGLGSCRTAEFPGAPRLCRGPCRGPGARCRDGL